jgi:type I restriction enzyme R subunit
VLKLKPFNDMGTPLEIINNAFGGKAAFEKAIQELEHELYNEESAA